MKHLIEEKSKTTIEIDSETGAVSIASAEDPLQGLRVLDLVKAIGRGFSPERALAILDDDMLMLDVLDLSKMVGTKSDMERIKGMRPLWVLYAPVPALDVGAIALFRRRCDACRVYQETHVNEWTVIAILFSLAVLAAGLGTLCDSLDTRNGELRRKP